MQRTTVAGRFPQYEISNWARLKNGELAACKHNLQYWHNQPYLGFGAGAHGFHSGYRLVNTPSLRYILTAAR
jgi:oxygen-independent coproporphyrinogen-3 oxidase